jgi:hypothetical protein
VDIFFQFYLAHRPEKASENQKKTNKQHTKNTAISLLPVENKCVLGNLVKCHPAIFDYDE